MSAERASDASGSPLPRLQRLDAVRERTISTAQSDTAERQR